MEKELYTVQEAMMVTAAKQKKLVVANCGHETYMVDFVTAFGVTSVYAHSKNYPPRYCHKCLGKMARLCACPRCNEVIFIGDPVTSNYVELSSKSKFDQEFIKEMRRGKISIHHVRKARIEKEKGRIALAKKHEKKLWEVLYCTNKNCIQNRPFDGSIGTFVTPGIFFPGIEHLRECQQKEIEESLEGFRQRLHIRLTKVSMD